MILILSYKIVSYMINDICTQSVLSVFSTSNEIGPSLFKASDVRKWLYGPRQANLVLIAYASSEGSSHYLRLTQMVVWLEILSPRPILIVQWLTTNKISRAILWDGLRCFVSTALKSITKPWKICVQLLLSSTAASGFWPCSKIVVALPTTDFVRVTVLDL